MLNFLKSLFAPRQSTAEPTPAMSPVTGWVQVVQPLMFDRAKTLHYTVLNMLFKPTRKVSKVFIHCSASDDPKSDNIETIAQWHKARGFTEIGYHFYINKAGIIWAGRNLNKIPAAQKGHNTGAIAICLGGLKVSKFTDAQKQSLVDLCAELYRMYDGALTYHGHREVEPNKTCPVFDYKSLLEIGEGGKLKTRTIIKVK